MKKVLKIILFFLLSYVLAQGLFFVFAKENFFTSPMYILLPIVAFFGLFLVTPIVEDYTKWNRWTILAIFLAVSVFCYILVVYIYAYQVIVVLNDKLMPSALDFFKDFWAMFISSSFLGFVVSGAIGIIASKVISSKKTK